MTAPRREWTSRAADVHYSTPRTRSTYDHLARWYDLIEAPFERHAHAAGLQLLDARPGERILEVGFGTGHTLAALAQTLGQSGLVVGADLSQRMAQRTRRRLKATHAALLQADARHLPLRDAGFDAVTMSFILDLIATDDIPTVLAECRRVLRPDGRLVIVCIDLPKSPGRMTRLYLGAHRRWPRLVDCRPLPIHDILTSCRYHPTRTWTSTIAGIAVAATTATTQPESG